MDVEGNVFARATVAVAFEGADLVEGHPEIGGAEGFVLVELQAVLVVEVDRPKFAERHGEIDFVGGIEAGEDGVGGLDEAADALGVAGEVGDGEGVADGGDVGMVHRLVGFGLDAETGLRVMGQHRVEGGGEQFGRACAGFGFAQISALAGEPEHDEIGAELAGDIDRLLGAIKGVLTVGFAIGRVAAIDRARGKPEAGSDDLGHDALAVELVAEGFGFFEHLRVGLRVDFGHGVVVVKHHRGEAQFLQSGEFPREGLGRAGLGAVGVAALTEVPWAGTEAILGFDHVRDWNAPE